MWRRILGAGELDPEDDFFALGGDSLTTAEMLNQMLRKFQVDPESFSTLDFFEEPTIASLARLVDAAQSGSGDGGCIALRKTGSRTPVFCVPASNWQPYYLRHLAKDLGSDQPFYVAGATADSDSILSIEEAAARLVTAIRTVRPRGPYIMAGHCYGGVVAFAAARLLVQSGDRVGCVALFDTPAPGYPKIRKSWRRYFALANDVLRGRRPVALTGAGAHLRILGRVLGRRFAARAASAVGDGVLVAGRDQPSRDRLAMRAYTPRPIAAPIVQFLAADHPASTRLLDDARLGWRDFAQAGFEVRSVPGDHNSIFEPAHAPALARELRTYLESGSAHSI